MTTENRPCLTTTTEFQRIPTQSLILLGNKNTSSLERIGTQERRDLIRMLG
jgi:hypothetical protein